MSEAKGLFWALAGVLLGGLLGLGGVYLIYSYSSLPSQSPSLALLVWLGIGGGGVLLGGWLGLSAGRRLNRRHRAHTRSYAKGGKYVAKRKRR